MSDLRPTGCRMNIDGVERTFMFSLQAIDDLQEQSDMSISEYMNELIEDMSHERVKEAMEKIEQLLNAMLIRDEDEPLKPDHFRAYIETKNYEAIALVILREYGYDMPEDEGEDPNQMSEETN